MRKIAAVSTDGLTLTLEEPLEYTHLGVSVLLADGTKFEGRAEVGLLTRNIVVRGSQHQEWDDTIEACPDGFNTGSVLFSYLFIQSCIHRWLSMMELFYFVLFRPGGKGYSKLNTI